MWDNDLDCEVRAQLVQASAQAYLSYGEEKKKGKGKIKGKGKGKFLVRPSCLTMCFSPIRRIFKTPDTHCSYGDTTRPFQPTEEGYDVFRCRWLWLYNFETFVNTVGGKVSFSMEPTRQTPSTPIAPIAVDTRTKNILDVHAEDDDDESWSSEDDHKSGWNTRFKGGTYRCMLYGVVL